MLKMFCLAATLLKKETITRVFSYKFGEMNIYYIKPPLHCFCIIGIMILNEVQPRSGTHHEV